MNWITKTVIIIIAIIEKFHEILGWKDCLIIEWIVYTALYYMTNIAVAKKNGQWRLGKIKAEISGMIAVIIVAAGIDLLTAIALRYLPLICVHFQYRGIVFPLVLIWFIVIEMIKIIKKAVFLGASVPPFLLKFLLAIQNIVGEC